MKLETLFCLGLFGVACTAQADTLSRAITPPFYTDVQRLDDGSPYYFHDDQWAAFVFLRLPSCVPADFDLLDGADLAPAFPNGPPRVFGCPLTVDGHAIFKSPDDFVPVQANLKGLGAVPVWFVKLSDIQAVLAGNKLTVTQLLNIPSLRMGFANLYDEVDEPGVFRPQGEGNGSIHVTASGSLENGASFQFEWLERGVKNGDGQSFVRHVRIAFK
jgi:hypothetical protein